MDLSHGATSNGNCHNRAPGVNFINILHANFSYKHLFGSFSLVTCKWKKLPKRRWYAKFARKMLMKLTIEQHLTRGPGRGR